MSCPISWRDPATLLEFRCFNSGPLCRSNSAAGPLYLWLNIETGCLFYAMFGVNAALDQWLHRLCLIVLLVILFLYLFFFLYRQNHLHIAILLITRSEQAAVHLFAPPSTPISLPVLLSYLEKCLHHCHFHSFSRAYHHLSFCIPVLSTKQLRPTFWVSAFPFLAPLKRPPSSSLTLLVVVVNLT